MAHSAHGQQRTISHDRDDTQGKWKKEKSQNQEENAIRHLTNEMDKLSKAMNDFKSDLGMIKQHIFNKSTQQPTQNGRHFQNGPLKGRPYPPKSGRGQAQYGGSQKYHQPQMPHAPNETQSAFTAYKSGTGPSFQQRRIFDSAEEDDSQFAAMASMAAQPSRSDYSIVRLHNSVPRKRRSITPDRYNSPAPSSTGISGFSELDMDEEELRHVKFKSMASYHVDKLLDAKANPFAAPYQIKTSASDALRLSKPVITSVDDEQHEESPSPRSDQEQPELPVGTNSPALGTLAPAQDDYQPLSTPISIRRTTRSRAKPTAPSISSLADPIVYPSDDEMPSSTPKMAIPRKFAKSPASRFSPTWDQIIAAKGRTSKFIRKLRRQAKQPAVPDSPDGA
jgi:hypothetical protein